MLTTVNFAKSVPFADIIRAAIRKDLAGDLLARAVGRCAYTMANNAGGQTGIQALIVFCGTTAQGKVRKPAAGTVAGLVIDALASIVANAENAGARTGEDSARTAAGNVYANACYQAFTLACEGAASVRKATADAKKASRPVPSIPSSTDASTAATTAEGATVEGPTVASLLTELDALKSAAAQRDNALKECARLHVVVAGLEDYIAVLTAANTVLEKSEAVLTARLAALLPKSRKPAKSDSARVMLPA